VSTLEGPQPTHPRLIEAGQLLAPSEIAGFASKHARLACAADRAVVYLANYGLTSLVPLPGPATADRRALALEGSFAGRAFIVGDSVVSDGGSDGIRVWCPLDDGALRIGVVEIVFDSANASVSLSACHRFAAELAALIVLKERYGDVFAFVRRSARMSVAAEMQWSLLPPTSFTSPQVTITGMLEPAMSVAGDAFDYALDGSVAHLAVFDAMGHGLPSAMQVAVAVGAYRNARRSMLSLEETMDLLEETLSDHTGDARFVTALLLELDVESGSLVWSSAGHPEALVLRGRHLVHALGGEPSPPLGLGLRGRPLIGTLTLEPEDSVLAFSDGVIESRRSPGDYFSVERLADFVTREIAAGRRTPETLRRLAQAILQYQNGQLQDDATVLMATWHGRLGSSTD
jgi:Stage II sporulation protein E (SpoIIE)